MKDACGAVMPPSITSSEPVTHDDSCGSVLRAKGRFDALQEPLPQGRHRLPEDDQDADDGQVGLDRRRERRGRQAGQPEDIANVALFLASDESRMVNGAAIPAEGGFSAY